MVYATLDLGVYTFMDGAAIGRKVQTMRKQLGWSQHKLAERAGVSYAMVNKLENGLIGAPRNDTLSKLAGALRISAAALIADPTDIPQESEEFIMARRIAVIVPDLTGISDPVEFIRGITGLPEDSQAEMEEFLEWQKFRSLARKVAVSGEVRRSPAGMGRILGRPPLRVKTTPKQLPAAKITEEKDDYQAEG